MTTTATAARTPYQRSIADYWDTESNAVNHDLAAVDGLFHHHYGLGKPDFSVLERGEEAVTRELHRLETQQATFLIDQMGELSPQDRALDAGCGRGGTSIMLHERHGCHVDGVTLSTKQAADGNAEIKRRGHDKHVHLHVKNMLDTGFPAGEFAVIWNNESTMYVDLESLFASHARLLRPGGRYLTITGAANDTYGNCKSKAVSAIDTEYGCDVHFRSDYFRALTQAGLVPTTVTDLTPATLPYWRLRTQSHLTTGVEQHFLGAYENASFHYLLIVAEKP